eukprot:CAMPEP_0179221464 /NCGR_PEP_ID=MMETSP0797-20121207/6206_1 /TAXON_ID=47934 /ORGANISM="Dinophysis acuminata, Strain DAEP01" /LENGTH=530 /DNA_ID=CAMNT_0020928251 /DNA_START=84 /DNA_END=1676 /DNA_ORIENTATION=-
MQPLGMAPGSFRRAFGLGMLTGALACAGIAAVALLGPSHGTTFTVGAVSRMLPKAFRNDGDAATAPRTGGADSADAPRARPQGGAAAGATRASPAAARSGPGAAVVDAPEGAVVDARRAVTQGDARYDLRSITQQVDRTRIGTLNVPYVGVGTLSWGAPGLGGIADQVERTFLKSSGNVNAAESLILASALRGVDFIDTAERYGNSISTAVGLGYGETEDLIGRTMGELGVRAVVATKFTPTPTRTTADSVVEAADASRRRLGVGVIDLYQIQIPDIVQPWARVPGAPEEWSTPKDEIYWEGMVKAYKLGIIANVGVCNYGPTLLRRAHAYFKSHGVPLVSNQINYSLLYRRNGAQATADVCRELGVAVLAYYPLAMGALSGKWMSGGPAGLGRLDTMVASRTGIGPVGEPLNPALSGKTTLEQLDIAGTAQGAGALLARLREVAAARKKTVAQVALNWVVCKGAIPIPGARTAKQAIDNAGALGWRLSAREVRLLEAAADEAEGEFQGAGFKRSDSKFVGYGFEEWTLD